LDSKNKSSERSQEAERLLVEDHAALDELFRFLLGALDAGDAIEAFAHLDLLWARLAMHIRAEHLHLFPAILNAALESDSRDRGDVTVPLEEAQDAIARLRDDHEFFMLELAESVRTMREMQHEPSGEETAKQLSPVRQRVISVSNRLEKHNRLEEDLVYRWPKVLLDASEQSSLGEQVLKEIENLPPRFRT
jgi:hemerythrin superfamily protein